MAAKGFGRPTGVELVVIGLCWMGVVMIVQHSFLLTDLGPAVLEFGIGAFAILRGAYIVVMEE